MQSYCQKKTVFGKSRHFMCSFFDLKNYMNYTVLLHATSQNIPPAYIFLIYRQPGYIHNLLGVPRRQPHRRSGLATLPSVGAIP